MTDSELTGTLNQRLLALRERVAAACIRADRAAEDVTIIAVTKTVSVRVAQIAFDLGMNNLAESRPQELWKKQAAMPHAAWHLIGHLQRNKIEKTVPLVSLIHSVDSLRLLEALDSFGRSQNRIVPVLLEVNYSREANKGRPRAGRSCRHSRRNCRASAACESTA